ncbi:MAG: T6SS effector amidase Tae4 family protein [Betaproteobacteria bacterium]|jgi:pyruvate/2-oxoglutarate dehydrogenase complex dihydrolipoamide acyltransferase (E2) component|nr:T6SS effector amidase Tae4 family protein [Betaproteobacteria bacterium]
MGFIDINVPDTIEPASAFVSEILVNRGEWVKPGDEVMTLTVGEKKINVASPHTGVIMKVLVAQGDSVSRKTALIHLKDVNNQRPTFFNAWRVFSQVNVNVSLIGKIFGSKVKQNIEIPKKEDGKWTNACTIRMSYVLNRTGFPIQPDKYGTVTARDGMWYIYRVSDMLLHLKDTFGAPDIEVNRVPVQDDFKEMKGILVVTGDGPNAKGHITLWNGLTCADICHFAGDDNGAFSPRKAALWLLP